MEVAQDCRSQQAFVSSIRGGGQKTGLWVAAQAWYVLCVLMSQAAMCVNRGA